MSNQSLHHHFVHSLLPIVMILWLVTSPLLSHAQAPLPTEQLPSVTTLDISQFPVATLARDVVINREKGTISLIVELEDKPLALYTGGIPGLAPTHAKTVGTNRLDVNATASQAYIHHLKDQQQSFIQTLRQVIPQAKVRYTYQIAYNGVSIEVPMANWQKIASLPGVKAVHLNHIKRPQMDASLPWIGAPTLWNDLGGQDVAGEGIKAAIIDTGVVPTNTLFSNPDPLGKPYSFPPGYPKGYCATHSGFCNGKIIAARVYTPTSEVWSGEVITAPLDIDGHGTHTAGTTAGNRSVVASVAGITATISGVAPRAWTMHYKACWADDENGEGGGCPGDSLVAAINDAIADGADVINYSIGGPASDPFSDPDAQAMRAAVEAGIVVATSAGNSGPSPGTVGSPADAPWVISVGASTTNRNYIAELTLSGSGSPPTGLFGPSLGSGASGPFIDLEGIPDSQGDASGMALHPYDPGTLTGKIVLVKRGVIARVAKSTHVAAGGAIGMVFYNQASGMTQNLDLHAIPTIHLSYEDGMAVKAWLDANPVGATATIGPGQCTTVQGDVMASFSSRGPSPSAPGWIKPDMIAPGVDILSGYSQGNALTPSDFIFIGGTSMSSPHVAGAVALLRQLHPDWTPEQIKSALMTTAATQGVTKEDGTTPADPFDRGSGRINLNNAGDPGLTFSPYSSLAFPKLITGTNRTMTATDVTGNGGTYTISVIGLTPADDETLASTQSTLPTLSVTPTLLTVPSGGSATFTVTVDVAGADLGGYFGEIDLNDGTHQAHLPVWAEASNPLQNDIAKEAWPHKVQISDTIVYTLTVSNDQFQRVRYNMVDHIPSSLEVDPDSVTGYAVYDSDTHTVRWGGSLNAARVDFDIQDSRQGGPTTLFGFIDLTTDVIPPANPFTCPDECDEAIVNVTGINPFSFDGQTYTSVGMVTNGYVIPGGGTSLSVSPTNQNLPDSAIPNGLWAPFWTDLDMAGGSSGGGHWYIAQVNGVFPGATALIMQWRDVQKKGDPSSTYNFEIIVPLDDRGSAFF
ncbi:MAG TPA: hypothetical protein EYH31_12700, partial [Anaerolineae bacterium]|nr:hypothetical protein [Anaerolineae bacterium]